MNDKINEKNIKYNNMCAFALSTGKPDVEAGKHFLTIDNNVYAFSNPVAKLLFRILPGRVQKADDQWEKSNK